jgi:small subunit ribosomal protein S18
VSKLTRRLMQAKMKKKKRKKKPVSYTRENKCRFCRAKVKDIDYKDIGNLSKLMTGQGKIFSRKRSGNCAAHQRQMRDAIKLARFMALLPYIG